MSVREFPEIIQGTKEWDDERRGIVTASVVGLLLTPTGKVANNDKSRGLVPHLAAERITGHTDPTFTSDDMLRGLIEEPIARDLYSKTYAKVIECGFMVRDDWGFSIGYSPDGLVGDDGLIEVKSRRQKKHVETIVSDAVPVENMAQCQAALLVSGRKWLDYISYSAGMPMWHKRVLPDPNWFEAIVESVRAFEATVATYLSTYAKAVKGLPMTERTSDLEIRI